MNPATLSDVRTVMKKYGLFAHKRWGQNFLIDKNILRKITDAADVEPNQYLVEIGPGLGGLTRELASRSRGVLAIEIDRHLQKPLEEMLADLPQVRLLFRDVLEVNLEAELKQVFDLTSIDSFGVCANIPYNITSPIIFKLLEECPSLKSAILMMQKEVAERILARPGGKNYGVLTLTTTYHAQVEFIMDVSRNCFYPKPEVDSRVIRITPHKTKPVQVDDEKAFKRFIRAAFQKRRKTMLNICTDYFAQDKKTCEELLVGQNISPKLRPETLGLAEFASLYEVFSQ